ncbi:MAG: TdeIII family type II restriction endonuclease [Gemmatales bacterium]|nr:TdeIII family type II restriction endonuclease [Gemmatales bacterium]MDW7994454.1 TdeIII family type II restriction endonuclease [Gemmatales bacterium]
MAGVIPPDIRDRICQTIRELIIEKIESRHSRRRTYSVFHQALFPNPLLKAWEFERTVSTALGNSFQTVAKLLAQSSGLYQHVSLQSKIAGWVSNAARATIDAVINKLRRKGMTGFRERFTDLAQKVAAAYHGNEYDHTKSSQKENRVVNGTKVEIIIDLYLRRKNGEELFFEMKSPLPNKDQCVATTEKLLLVHAIRKASHPQVQTYYAMPFNPFERAEPSGSSRASYKHSIAQKYLDLERQVLIGNEFWDLLAGPGTYRELIDLYKQVGQRIRSKVLKVIGFRGLKKQ